MKIFQTNLCRFLDEDVISENITILELLEHLSVLKLTLTSQS